MKLNLSSFNPVPLVMGATAIPTSAGHPFLCTDAAGGRIAMVTADRRVQWEFMCDNPQDCWVTPDGNYLFCHAGGVIEKINDGRTLWDYTCEPGADVNSVQPLNNGRFLVMENGPCRLVEVDTFGNVEKETLLTPPPPSKQISVRDRFRGIRRSADGHTLVCRKGEHQVEELDADGKSLRRIPVAGDVHMALRLPDGNLLIALGEGRRIQELDANLKVVWEVKENDIPGNPLRMVTGFQRLPNGNTVVCNFLGNGFLGKQPHVFEVTREKKLVWEFSDHEHFATINQIQLLDVPGDVTAGKILR